MSIATLLAMRRLLLQVVKMLELELHGRGVSLNDRQSQSERLHITWQHCYTSARNVTGSVTTYR